MTELALHEGVLTRAGVRIRYAVGGDGPPLLLMGAPMDADAFVPLAAEMKGYRIVLHDPRGISGSTLDDPDTPSTPELRAGDVAALMDELGIESADVFGSSGGAVTALALAEHHPERVRTAVVHEPPLLSLLPDAAEREKLTDATVAAFHSGGLGAAWAHFFYSSGMAPEEPAPGEAPPGFTEPSAQDRENGRRFFVHELRATTRYVPDAAALAAAPHRIAVGIGADSGGLDTMETSKALARLLGTAPVVFPGGHTGFAESPADFAALLAGVMEDSAQGG